jgi:hypothetical protein
MVEMAAQGEVQLAEPELPPEVAAVVLKLTTSL